MNLFVDAYYGKEVIFMHVQYVTNEQGQKTGVLLDVATFQRLLKQESQDPDLLTGMSDEELTALAASQLAPVAQEHLKALLLRQKEGVLNSEELGELDDLLLQIDQLTILKTRAQYTLNQYATIP